MKAHYEITGKEGDAITVLRDGNDVEVYALTGTTLTLAEARQLANALTAMADEED
ncbi:hypothetical protein [Enterococcus sp. AZ136]|uniref:hypothetical protein n=1 Tax=Enterococcus sp. AZ136 TaxID=2774788 RepID=UPI003D2A3854